MVNAELALPTPRQIASTADFASIGLWATQQRFELARLTKELQSLLASIDAPTGGPHLETDDAGPAPTAFAPVIDIMLEAAMEQLDAGADAARQEATAVVATAMREATELLMSVGADPTAVRRVMTRSPEVAPVLRRPRRAAELWDAMGASRGSLQIQVPGTPTRVEAAPDDAIDPSFDGGDLISGDASQVHELFWGSALDRPVRERLRRFGQRIQP